MTILEILTAASAYLAKHDVEHSRLNAEHLLAHVLSKRRLDLYLEFDQPIDPQPRADLRELIRRRGAGEPLQHLIGTTDFCGLTVVCDTRALIPRPETEQLVEWIREDFRHRHPAQILDVGTGSGVIALALANAFPESRVVGVDVSPDALALARENSGKLGLAGRIELFQSDLLPPNDEHAFSCVAANLPYLASSDLDSLQREVQFDPRSALDGGADGLDIIRRLIDRLPDRLEKGGSLYLEIGAGQAQTVHEHLHNRNFRDIAIREDYQGIERFVRASYG